MIDTHCHLDLYPKPSEVIREAVKRGVYVIAVTTTPLAWEGNLRLVGEASRIRVAVGLHPELVAQRENEVELLCRLVPKSKYVGEVGMDGSPQNRPSLGAQREVLATVLNACRKAGGRVISLHSRLAVTPVLDEIERAGAIGKPILHWFSGTERELQRAVALGCWFSVGPAMLSTRKGRSLLAQMPLERLLTETDGPFGRLGEQSLHPWDVSQCMPELASAFRLSIQDVEALLRQNFRHLVTIP